LPPVLIANNISLGATLTPNVRELIGTKGIWNNRLFSTLRDSTVLVETNLLPVTMLRTTVARAFQPIPGIKPFQVTTKTTFMRSLLESPPSLEVHVTKEVAPRKLAFCAWSSGLWYYPDFLLDNFFFRGMTLEDMYASAGDLSSLQVGLVSIPKQPLNVVSMDEDDVESEEAELRRHLQKKQVTDRAAESWQTFVQVSPGGGGLGLTYSRNLFSGTPADDPLKSEWSDEGYAPMAKMEDARAVRLELSTTVSPNLSFVWSLKGTRRVGEYTKMGIGIGFADQGILMTIGWSRLGQGLNLPIVLCSKDEATHDAAILASIFTWASYLAIEFGYVRPRDRKRRREAAARRHNQLKKLVPQKRAESEQAIQLMVDQVRRRQLREHEQDGLVIDRAEYGYWPPTDRKPKPGFEEPRTTDVFFPVANLVDRGQLVIGAKTVKVSEFLTLHIMTNV
jgi:DnaJ family protein C protein 11